SSTAVRNTDAAASAGAANCPRQFDREASVPAVRSAQHGSEASAPAAARHADRTRCSARMREEWRARIEAHAPRNRRMSKSYTHPILLSLYLACGAISANADADAASGPEAAHQVAQASGPQSRESLFGDDAGKPKAG